MRQSTDVLCVVIVIVAIFPVIWLSRAYPRTAYPALLDDPIATSPNNKPPVKVLKQQVPDPDEILKERLLNSIESDSQVTWQVIVFHHSATRQGDLKAFDRYHRRHFGDKNGVKYHFIIGNGSYSDDGEIEISSRWQRQIAAAHNHFPENAPDSIAINLVGNFEVDKPTEKQLLAVVRLIRVLMEMYSIPEEKVTIHRDIDNQYTLCPGKNFPQKEIIEKATIHKREKVR
ncbi:peptidoglycan recognition family protein [Planctomycetota bacterium]